MATSGESFLLDLSSATATKTGAAREERYRLTLNPGINIPYLAEPRAQLEALTFANVFTNIDDGFYKNAKLKVTWNPYVYNGNQTVKRHQKELEITIPQGHYDAVSLAHKIGELLYSDTTITEWPAITNYPLTGEKVSRKAATYITATSTLFSDMQVLATLPSKDLVKSVTIPDNATSPKGSGDKYLDVTDEPSELTAYVGGWIRLNHIGQVFARIVGIEAILSDLDGGISGLALGRSRIHLNTDVDDIIDGIGSGAKTFHVIPPSLKFKQEGHTDIAAPTETADADFFGYEALGACRPNFDETSPWALSMTVDQMRGIANADQKADAPPHVAMVGATASTQFVIPITMQPDNRTGLLEAATGAPLLKIDNSSTLFTNALGYTVTDMVEQNPFTHRSSPTVTGEPAVSRAMDASKPGRLLRTTSVSFHCPSLVSSSYNQHGELAGAVMANVPIMVPSNNVQAWQSMYDASIPCSLHNGGVIDTIDFYLTNQDGDNIDMMGSDWLATVRLAWNRPSAPPLGSFGAEAESAYGLRDVIYAAQQQNGA
jgi:hypothetical protein